MASENAANPRNKDDMMSEQKPIVSLSSTLRVEALHGIRRGKREP